MAVIAYVNFTKSASIMAVIAGSLKLGGGANFKKRKNHNMYGVRRSLGAFGAGSLLRTPPIDSTSENSSPYDPIRLRIGAASYDTALVMQLSNPNPKRACS